MSPVNKWPVMMLVCCVFIVHTALVFRMMPPRFLVSGELSAFGDVSRYFASAHSSMSAGGMAGYDPYVMAGYPAGGWNSMGKKSYEIAHFLLPLVPLPLLMSWQLFMGAMLAPFLLWWASIRISGGRSGFVLPFLVSVCFWHFENQIGIFLQCRNVGFPFTAALIPVAIALYGELLNSRHPTAWGLGLGLVVAGIFYGHPVLMVPLLICCIVYSAFNLKKFRELSIWGGMAVAVTLTLVLALPWLRVLVKTLPDYQPFIYEGFSGSLKHLVMDLFSDRVYQHNFDRNFLFQAAVVWGGAGTFLALRHKGVESRKLLACGIAAAICLGIAYGFSLSPSLRSWQPYRFLVPAMFLLLPAFCCGIQEARVVFSGSGRGMRLLVCLMGVLLLPRFTSYLIDLSGSKDAVGIPSHQAQVMERLAVKEIKGRILCDDIQLGHLIPYFSNKAVIGGLSAQAFIKEGFAGVDYEGRLFGRIPSEWEIENFCNYLNVYAIEYMILTSPEWVKFVEQNPARFEKEEMIGPYCLYHVKAWSGYVMGGGVDVRVDSRGLSLSELKSQEYVLKFHYSPALQAPRGATLERVSVLDDPIGFIRLRVPVGWTDCRVNF